MLPSNFFLERGLLVRESWPDEKSFQFEIFKEHNDHSVERIEVFNCFKA